METRTRCVEACQACEVDFASITHKLSSLPSSSVTHQDGNMDCEIEKPSVLSLASVISLQGSFKWIGQQIWFSEPDDFLKQLVVVQVKLVRVIFLLNEIVKTCKIDG